MDEDYVASVRTLMESLAERDGVAIRAVDIVPTRSFHTGRIPAMYIIVDDPVVYQNGHEVRP